MYYKYVFYLLCINKYFVLPDPDNYDTCITHAQRSAPTPTLNPLLTPHIQLECSVKHRSIRHISPRRTLHVCTGHVPHLRHVHAIQYIPGRSVEIRFTKRGIPS